MKTRKILLTVVTFAFTAISLHSYVSFGESLNPEGVNPHQSSPRKKITQEQKNAAAEAKKKKKAEIEAKKVTRDRKDKSGDSIGDHINPKPFTENR
jgi:hypothetical protein